MSVKEQMEYIWVNDRLSNANRTATWTTKGALRPVVAAANYQIRFP